MDASKRYNDSVHLIGRLGALGAVCFMMGIPVIMCIVYDCWPTFSSVITAGSGLLAIMAPSAVAEVFAYAPILGSSQYITFITGNVLNMKLPVAISAQNLAGVVANTEEADCVSAMAVSLSSLETIIIVALGCLLLQPLQPVLTLAPVQTATKYMVPALMGALLPGTLNPGKGHNKINNKWTMMVAPAAMCFLGFTFVPGMADYQGYCILIGIVLSILSGVGLYKAGIITLGEKE